MARIRSIKPTFWTDEKVVLLPRDVRLTLLGLISAVSDDHGRLISNARIIRGAIYPCDDDISVADVTAHLRQIEAAGFVVRYSVNGDSYLVIRNWLKHQKVDKPYKSLLPDPPPFAENSGSVRRTFDDHSRRSGAERSGADTDLDMERSGDESPNTANGSTAPEPAAPPAALAHYAKMPDDAKRFMAMFYEPALTEKQRERFRDVLGQVYDALDPNHPGPKIRGGMRSKARSAEHLAEVCRKVMGDPPRDRDKAVVFLLSMLLDPPKGPTVSEKLKESHDAASADDDKVFRERKRRAIAWSERPENKAKVDELSRAMDVEFPAWRDSGFLRSARDSAMITRLADLAEKEPPAAKTG